MPLTAFVARAARARRAWLGPDAASAHRSRGATRVLRYGLLAAVVVCCSGSLELRAHEALLLQIRAVTERIQADPLNAELYLQRGDLYRQHHQWQPALDDIARAARLAPSLSAIDLLRGQVWLAAKRPVLALFWLDRFVSRHPDHARARLSRAQARLAVGQPLDAAADMSVTLAFQPTPDHYVARARALAGAGPAHVTDAIQGLDEGVARLGPIVTLQLEAIDLEVHAGRYEAALGRLETLERQTARQEVWLVRRGEILEAAGRRDAGRAAYLAATAAIADLPAHLRHRGDVEALAGRARAGARRLAAPPPAGRSGLQRFRKP